MTVAAISNPALASDPRGTWLTEDKDAALTISACGARLCGQIVWLESATDRSGSLRQDENNPDPGRQTRRICGLVVITGLEPSGPNIWAGSVYNPEDGKTYQGSITVLSDEALQVRAYIALPIFGKNQIWTRVRGPAAYNCRNQG
jgi:Uncharacterized protein conserved in bacteria